MPATVCALDRSALKDRPDIQQLFPNFTERIKVATVKPKMLQLEATKFSRQIGEANAFSRHLSLSSMYLGASRRPLRRGLSLGATKFYSAPISNFYNWIPPVCHRE